MFIATLTVTGLLIGGAISFICGAGLIFKAFVGGGKQIAPIAARSEASALNWVPFGMRVSSCMLRVKGFVLRI